MSFKYCWYPESKIISKNQISAYIKMLKLLNSVKLPTTRDHFLVDADQWCGFTQRCSNVWPGEMNLSVETKIYRTKSHLNEYKKYESECKTNRDVKAFSYEWHPSECRYNLYTHMYVHMYIQYIHVCVMLYICIYVV